MSYICDICNKTFTTNGGLKRHKNKITPCFIPNPVANAKFICTSCNKSFTTNQTLKNHMSKTCSIIKNKDKTINNQILELTNTVNALKCKLDNVLNDKLQNTTNIINNTMNNTQNITINITPFHQKKLEEKYIIEQFLDESTAAAEYNKLEFMERANSKNLYTKNLIKSLFLESLEGSFADDINNVNVYLSETREDAANIYQGNKKWLPKSTMSVLRKEFDIFIKKCGEISGHINYPEGTSIGYRNSIDASISLLQQMGNNDIIKDAKPEFNIILEANRDRLKGENII